MAQDPSYNVLPFLLPHLHLISSYRIPMQATLQVENALDYLMQAPKIVKEFASVYWHYFSTPPQDGTVFLTWQPQAQRGSSFSSDGYVWGDRETAYTLEVRGYTLEILVHRCGYRPGFDQITSHTRSRYHLINKNPQVQGPNPDPSLWIVHYSQAEPQARIPVQRVPILPEMQRMLGERRLLESQGQLGRNEFMLPDRGKWPSITSFAPGTQAQPGNVQAGAMYPGHPMQQAAPYGRQPQYFPQAQGSMIGPSPAKRPRQVPPSQMPGSIGGGVPPTVPGMSMDTNIEDEENTAIGDLLDHLTPRDISTIRYTQHHEWMEEVFSSPYAAGQIAPIDLGLGVMGELAPLTEGLLDAPSYANAKKPESNPQKYEKLSPEKFEEFQNRVAKFMKDEETELERMKAEHAKKLEELTRGKTYMKAERRLREAVWGESQTARRSSHASISIPIGDAEEAEAKVNEVVEDVEKSLGVTLGPRKNVTCVDKGALIEELAPPPQEKGTNGDGSFANNNDATAGDATMIGGDDSAAGLLDQFTSNSLVSTPGDGQVPQAGAANQNQAPALGGEQVQPQQQQALSAAQNSSTMQNQSETPGRDDSMGLIEGMDLDIDMSGIGDPGDQAGGQGTDEWVMVESAQQQQQQQQPPQQQAQPHPPQHPPQPQQQPPANPTSTSISTTAQPPSTAANDTPADESSAGPPPQPESGTNSAQPGQAESTPGMFDSGDFHFDDTAGDALQDYGPDGELGLDIGMGGEDDAFGAAFHGTETRDGEGEGEGGN